MSFQSEYRILVAAVASYDRPPASSGWLVESCRRLGIELTLLGQGRPHPNNRNKPRVVAEYLRDHPEYDYVLQVDFKDVIFCATLREMFFKYRSFGRQIVASAERNCWPMASYAPRFPDTGTSNRYLNSGAIFATADAWVAAWDRMHGRERELGGVPPEVGRHGRHIFSSDQAAWSDLFVRGEADIALDSGCHLFQTLAHVDFDLNRANRDLALEGRRFANRETGGRPCLVHCNGRVPMDAWARYILEPDPAWAWPLIERIRAEPPSAMRDASRLGRLLLGLGLDDPDDDDVPSELLPFSGKGLGIRRRPSEFAPLLAWLATRPPIRSYVEAGVGNGGAFLATVEALRRSHPLALAIGVGPERSAILRDYVARPGAARYVPGVGLADGLRGLDDPAGPVDLALIDADRPDGDPRADWAHARSRCRLVAIHGIASPRFLGARSLWEEIRSAHRDTREFIDPRLPPGSRLGIGVVDLANPA